MLSGIERLGNKVPHPAVMFVTLCLLVIVLSWILALANVRVTTEVAAPDSQAATDPYYPDYPGGSVVPDLPSLPGAQYPDDFEIHTQTIHVQNLLSVDGVRFMFTSFVGNFNGFSAVGVIIIAMIGVGLAEESGLIAALIRKIVKVAPIGTLTFILVLAGMISSIASDAVTRC